MSPPGKWETEMEERIRAFWGKTRFYIKWSKAPFALEQFRQKRAEKDCCLCDMASLWLWRGLSVRGMGKGLITGAGGVNGRGLGGRDTWGRRWPGHMAFPLEHRGHLESRWKAEGMSSQALLCRESSSREGRRAWKTNAPTVRASQPARN